TSSAVKTLPMILGAAACSVVAGVLVTKVGYYVPFMIAGSIFSTIGSGLLSTWGADSKLAQEIGYQILAGFGAGLGLQVFCFEICHILIYRCRLLQCKLWLLHKIFQ